MSSLLEEVAAVRESRRKAAQARVVSLPTWQWKANRLT